MKLTQFQAKPHFQLPMATPFQSKGLILYRIQTNQTDQIDQRNQINQIDQRNQIDERNPIDAPHALKQNSKVYRVALTPIPLTKASY
jgi:hypothetical protein